MIEIVENSLQLALLLTFTILSGVYAYRRQNIIAGILTTVYGSYVLGDIYWLLYLVFFEHTPNVFYVPYLSWYAAYLFLFLMLHRCRCGCGGRTGFYNRHVYILHAVRRLYG